MLRTVKLSREREAVDIRGFVARGETRRGRFKSENEALRDILPDQCGGLLSSFGLGTRKVKAVRRPVTKHTRDGESVQIYMHTFNPTNENKKGLVSL